MNIRINSEQELFDTAKELFHTLVNLRYHSRLWDEKHGSALLAAKKKWERKADDLIVKYNMKKTQLEKEIKIEINQHESNKINP